MNAAAQQLVSALRLAPLPGEGGFFRVTSRTATASSIYFLITPEDFSALHRFGQDEIWHFYAGDPVEHAQFAHAGEAPRIARLGPGVAAGDEPQVFVAAGTWQGARIAAPRLGFALLGCTVSPPFEPHGYEVGAREELRRIFPGHAALIDALTR